MGKFSARAGRVPKNPLPDFNPYSQAIQEVQKVEEKVGPQVIQGAQAPLPTGPQPAPTGTPEVVDIPSADPSQSPVLQETPEIVRPKSREELISQVQQRGAFGEDDTYQPISREEAESIVDEDLEFQEKEGYQPIDINFDRASQIVNDSNLSNVKQGEAQAIVNLGTRNAFAISKVFDGSLNNPNNVQATQWLQKNNMITTDGKVDRRLGNAVALAIPALIKDEYVRRADENKEAGTAVDNPWDDTQISTPPTFDPNLTQGNLVGEIMKIINPVQSDSGFYSKDDIGNERKDPGASQVEAGLWKALHDEGLIESFNPDPKNPSDTRFRWTDDAVQYFKGTKNTFDQIAPKQRIAPSAFAPPAGTTYGKELLSKSAKEISDKAKVDKNQKISTAVKDTLSRMPLRINGNLAAIGQSLWADVEANIDETTGISTSKYAHLFRLDEERHKKFFIETKAKDSTGKDDATILEEVKAKMTAELAKIKSDFTDMGQQGQDAFYNKWFHAGANGRYHVLNTILDYQSSKVVRNLVENARTVNVKKGDNELDENFRYIVARNLSPTINGTKVSELGWNAILKESKKIIRSAAPIGEILSNPQHPQFVATLDKVIGKDGIADNETWGQTIQSYIDAYNYHKLPEGGSFQPKSQTQHDGIQNGPAIQGVQQGLIDIIDRVGLNYDDDGVSTVPGGDIRKLFTDSLPSVVSEVFVDDPVKAKAWTAALGNVSDKKAIAKGPVTESAYGKWHLYHADSAYKFLKTNPGMMNELKEGTDEATAVKELNLIISGALQKSFDTPHQLRLKRAGDLWGALGITPQIQGPLGNYIYFGSKTFNPELGQAETLFTTEQGAITRQKGTVGPSTAGKPVTKLVRDADSGLLVESEQRVGATIPNQLPVLTVQHIDSAVLSDMLLRVNQHRQGKVPLHVLPIHDAIITDVSSVRKYHQQINDSFVQINKNYNIAKEVQKGLRQAITEWRNSIDDNADINVHPNAGQYRALFGLINQQWQRNKDLEAANKTVPAANKAIIALAREIGIDPDPNNYIDQANYVKGAKLKKLMQQLDIKLRATAGLTSWIKDIEANQRQNFNKIKTRTYQYN